MYELYSVNIIFGLDFCQPQKMNFIQNVLSKIVYKLCQEQKMNFIQNKFLIYHLNLAIKSK